MRPCRKKAEPQSNWSTIIFLYEYLVEWSNNFILNFKSDKTMIMTFILRHFLDSFSYCITVQFEAVRGHCVEYAEMFGSTWLAQSEHLFVTGRPYLVSLLLTPSSLVSLHITLNISRQTFQRNCKNNDNNILSSPLPTKYHQI